MAYETILVETPRAVGPDHPEPAQGAECAECPADRRARTRRSTARRRRRDRGHRADRLGPGLRRRRRHQGDAGEGLHRRPAAATSSPPGSKIGRAQEADHRRRRRLRAGRRLRARHDVRPDPGRRQRQVRPARDQPRHHARRRRHAAADPRRRQGQGHGDGADRPDDGRRGGRAGRSRGPGRAARPICWTRRSSSRQTIAAKSQPIVAMAKDAVNVAYETTLAEGIRFERRLFYATFATDDRHEGMTGVRREAHARFHQPLSSETGALAGVDAGAGGAL